MAAGVPAAVVDLATGVVTVFCDGVQAYAAMLDVVAALRLYSRRPPSSAGWLSDRGRSSGLSMMALIGRNHTVTRGLGCQLPVPWYQMHISINSGKTSTPHEKLRPTRPVRHEKLEVFSPLEEADVSTIGRHTTAVARRNGRAAPRSRFRSADGPVLEGALRPTTDAIRRSGGKPQAGSFLEAHSHLTTGQSIC
ncbi:hypothetical protein HIM_06130 [Hirsutella minnesotensis 3608]|uniref:Uncharacterized protein n=1 Tax=Hirsutella minnesotensis 3608 TaxID=1043627 RepID=A0A0F8A514_9HYPO|nr:hypothetical protein HIM_06130 [Hirsutella minnesotensis 3608]